VIVEGPVFLTKVLESTPKEADVARSTLIVPPKTAAGNNKHTVITAADKNPVDFLFILPPHTGIKPVFYLSAAQKRPENNAGL
jgi:hypothetical protein